MLLTLFPALCRINAKIGDLLLQVLTWEPNCHGLVCSGLSVGLVQRLAASLDQYIAKESSDKDLCKDSAALDQLLQVGRQLQAVLTAHALHVMSAEHLCLSCP